MTTGNFCFYLQNRQIQNSQTGGQQYRDTFPFSIPWPRQVRKVISRRDNAAIFSYKLRQCKQTIEIGLEQAPFVVFVYFFLIRTCKKPADYGPHNTKNSSKSVIFSY
jgi:hypothetical protein